MYVSHVSALSLSEYTLAMTEYCSTQHAQPCNICIPLVSIGRSVLEKGYCGLSEAFSQASPSVKYTAEVARRKFLQMPLICVRVGDPNSGCSFSLLMEKYAGVDYSKIGMIVNGLA